MKQVLVFLTILLTMKGFAQTEEAAVKAVITSLFDGMRKGDTALMRSAFAPEAVLQTVQKRRDGTVSIKSDRVDAFLTAVAGPHPQPLDERIVFETIRIDGELASVWTPYKLYVGERFIHCGVDAFVLVKLGGAWKIQYLIDTRRQQGCDSLPGF
jgi:hypothetical protein